MIPAPAPGVYHGVPAREYHQWEALNASAMGDILRSPAHFRFKRDNPTEATPSMKLGSAAHAALLEPEKFGDVYVVPTKCQGLTKAQGVCRNTGTKLTDAGWLCGIHGKGRPPSHGPEVELLDPDDAIMAFAMSDAVNAHPVAGELLEKALPKWREVSFVWIDPETGCMCKARLDAVSFMRTGLFLLDLKTTTDARLETFRRHFHDRAYYRQSAHYIDAVTADSSGIVEPIQGAVIIVAENEPPHGIMVYTVAEEDLLQGAIECERARRLYAECTKSGVWPGYPADDNMSITLPPYAWAKIEREANK